MASTPMYRLAKHLLGDDPRKVIASRQAEGKTYRTIAREFWLETKGEVDVSETTLMQWMKNGSAA